MGEVVMPLGTKEGKELVKDDTSGNGGAKRRQGNSDKPNRTRKEGSRTSQHSVDS